jgi:TfoX/Sxy family transcriptional regulator of competence genes
MAFDETLAARVREILGPVAGFSEKKMFGGLCFLLHGNMCCGVLKDELVLRVAPERAQELLSGPHTRPMDFTGRALKGFVYVETGGLRTDRQRSGWVSMTQSFARSLPRKSRSKAESRRARPAKRQRT